MKIASKRHMYDLYNRGLLGNHLRNWPTLGECLANCGNSLVGVRGTARPGMPCVTMKRPEELSEECDILWCEGWNPNEFVFCESPDHHQQTLGGQVCRSENHYDLTYSIIHDAMRPAFAKETRYAQGIVAREMLRAYMDASTFDDVDALLDIYDGAVIEFSCFSRDIGVLPHRNTVIWEVRNY